ncbi:alcohol dehydrogenase [Thermocladium modestius]|uniref:Alcohol dehydrogenase n=1 Tax=Thermocladium modestius TaxID=62609 RepID=A0A830H061_9CREN|nr:alcohol dehydrogenase catalytic domain-containing protein [Thermocladium modestius]GGP21969.1 alcohol dehydrogenase [Thermocladium modestius]
MGRKTLAAVLHEYNKPLSLEYIDLEPGPGEAIINVKASGVCGRDIVIWRGGFKLNPPLVLGHEVFGELNDKPVGVYGAVTCGKCDYCRTGRENLCNELTFLGEGRLGGYAEAVAVPTRNIFELPDEQFEKYAAATCPLATSIHAARLADPRGRKVMVTGAGGSVGMHMIQYLKTLGAKVIAVTSSGKKPKVEKYADEVVLEGQRYPGKVDIVYDNVGAPTINEGLRSLDKEGTLVLIGNVEGQEIVLKRPALTIMREQRIVGSAAYTSAEVREAVKLIHDGAINTEFIPYKLKDVNKAIDDVINRRVLGKAVLIP